MKSTKVNYAMVGGFVILVVVGLVISVAMLTGRTGATDDYYTVYDNVTGIEFGTRVLYEGFQIGQVEEVTPIDENGKVRFRVDMTVTEDWRIPQDSVAEIAASGLLAAVTVSIRAGDSGIALTPGDLIPSEESANVIDAVSGLASNLSRIAERDLVPLLGNLNRVSEAVASMMGGDGEELVGDIRGILQDIATRAPGIFDNIDEITGQLNTSSNRIAQLLNRENVAELDAIIGDLGAASTNLAVLTEQMGDTRKTADELLQRLNTVVADNQLDVDRSIVDMRHSVESVARHIDSINQNLEGAARNMFEFSRQIRQNPGLLLGGKPPQDEAVQ